MTIKRFLCDNPNHREFEARRPSEEHKLYCPACRAAWEQEAMKYMIEKGPSDMLVQKAVEMVQSAWYNAVGVAIESGAAVPDPVEEMQELMSCWSD